MPKMIVDGREIEFKDKQMILPACQEAGIEVPHYCYHPGLSSPASCRICLVEVEGMPKLVPACYTPARDGMVVHTRSIKAVANQKQVMEFLLINHPLDCPVCDKAGECGLQDYSFGYGRAQSRFEEDKHKKPKKDIGPNLLLYTDRCIMCTRCVRFTREIAGTCELMVDGRGHREEIDIFPGKPVTNSISLNVIDICPVGALLDKQFLFKQRVWLLKRAPSISPCDAGGENIWIEHNEGVVHRITPRYNAEVNKWWISDETRHACQALTDSRRLLHPRVKQHGAQGASGWPAALEAADRGMVSLVHQHGQGSLCAVLSPMSSCEEAWLLGRYIRGLDRNALLVVGPVPATQDEVFKHYVTGRETFRIQGEKVPNRRGVERVIALLGGPNARWEDLLSGTRDDVKRLRGAWVVGGYLSNWVGGDLPALLGRGFVVLQDVLETVLAERCDVVLPAAMWAEKSGCWENHQGKLQAFAAAIDPPAGVDRECDVYYRLLQKTESCEVAELRRAMGEPFTSVSLPREAAPTEPAFDFVEL